MNWLKELIELSCDILAKRLHNGWYFERGKYYRPFEKWVIIDI